MKLILPATWPAVFLFICLYHLAISALAFRAYPMARRGYNLILHSLRTAVIGFSILQAECFAAWVVLTGVRSSRPTASFEAIRSAVGGNPFRHPAALLFAVGSLTLGRQSPEDYGAVQALRDDKTGGRTPQSPCVGLVKRRAVCRACGSPFLRTANTAKGKRRWHCGNEGCDNMVALSDTALEARLTALLNRLIVEPSLAEPPKRYPQPLSFEAERLTQELNKADFNEEAVGRLIFACAAEKYRQADDGSRVRRCRRLREDLEARQPLEAFDPVLFEAAADALLIGGGTLALCLPNGTIITEETQQ